MPRPKMYNSNAQRQAAYRARMKQKLFSSSAASLQKVWSSCHINRYIDATRECDKFFRDKYHVGIFPGEAGAEQWGRLWDNCLKRYLTDAALREAWREYKTERTTLASFIDVFIADSKNDVAEEVERVIKKVPSTDSKPSALARGELGNVAAKSEFYRMLSPEALAKAWRHQAVLYSTDRPGEGDAEKATRLNELWNQIKRNVTQ